jgi:hypothetical protein
MCGILSPNGASDSQSLFLGKRSNSFIVEIDFCMSSEIQDLSQAELLNLGPGNSAELGSAHWIRSGDASSLSI